MNEQQALSPKIGGTAVSPDGVVPGTGPVERGVDLLLAGGPVVGILLAMSVAALAIVLVKPWQFHVAQVGDRRVANEGLILHRDGRTDAALDRLAASRSPIALVLALDGELNESVALKTALAEGVKKGAAPRIRLKADGRAGATQVVAVMEVLREAEIERLRLLTVPGGS